MTDCEEFKFELNYIKKKWQVLKENVTNNILKLKEPTSEWTLKCKGKGILKNLTIFVS